MRLDLRIVVSIRQQYTDPARPICLLCACADRPCERRANTCNEVASPQGASLVRPMIITYHTWEKIAGKFSSLMSHMGHSRPGRGQQQVALCRLCPRKRK